MTEMQGGGLVGNGYVSKLAELIAPIQHTRTISETEGMSCITNNSERPVDTLAEKGESLTHLLTT